MPKQIVVCQSGETGMRSRIREIYDDYEEFLIYNQMYNIVERLNYHSARKLWEDNPIVEGSSNPKDFKIYHK